MTFEKVHFKFPKHFRLHSKKTIGVLFKEGARLSHGPLMLYYKESVADNNQYLIAVPKRKITKAANRNRIKRMIRESIRVSEISFSKHYDIALIYNKSVITPFPEIKDAVQQALSAMKNASFNKI
ncbi:MAG: ribonuclease P protein component [Flavobacteriales bacterium]|nr:ribonuclease P protein component [Flavobacteriales bacterium]